MVRITRSFQKCNFDDETLFLKDTSLNASGNKNLYLNHNGSDYKVFSHYRVDLFAILWYNLI